MLLNTLFCDINSHIQTHHSFTLSINNAAVSLHILRRRKQQNISFIYYLSCFLSLLMAFNVGNMFVFPLLVLSLFARNFVWSYTFFVGTQTVNARHTPHLSIYLCAYASSFNKTTSATTCWFLATYYWFEQRHMHAFPTLYTHKDISIELMQCTISSVKFM